MKNYFIFAAMAVVLAACQPNNGMSTKGYRSINPTISIANQAGIAFKNPHQTAWQQSSNYAQDIKYSQVFECHDAGCSPPSFVFFNRVNHNQNMMFSCSCFDEIVQSTAKYYQKAGRTLINQPIKGKYKSYDTISFYWAKNYGNRTVEGYELWILMRNSEIVLEGRSPNKSSSQKAVEHFLAMVEIEPGGSSD